MEQLLELIIDARAVSRHDFPQNFLTDPARFLPASMLLGMNSSRTIRNVAVGVPIRGNKILVQDYRDTVKEQSFHRALGGGIEFGETSEVALRREFMEELGVQLETVVLLGVLENVFEYEGQPGHEVIHVFSVESAELDAIPLDAQLRVLDEEGSLVRWVELHDGWSLYPDGIRELIEPLITDQ